MFAIALALFLHLQKLWLRYWRSEELFAGACLVWLALVLGCSISVEGAAFVFSWPLLAVVIVWLCWSMLPMLPMLPRWSSWEQANSRQQAWLWAVGLWPGVLLLTPLIELILIALTPAVAAPGIIIFALLLSLMPLFLAQLAPYQQFFLYGSCGLAALMLVGGYATSDFTEKRPRPYHLAYLYDGVQNRASWFSRDAELNTWSQQYFQQGRQHGSLAPVAFDKHTRLWLANAPGKLLAPEILVLSDRILQKRSGPVRSIELHLRSPRLAPNLRISLSGGRVYAVQLDGRKIATKLPNPWHFQTYGYGADGVVMVVEMEVGSKLQVQALDRSYALPEITRSPRPANLIPRAFSDSDTSMAYMALDL